MRSEAEVDLVLELAAAGRNPSEIAAMTGISRSTIRDWVAGRLPRNVHRFERGLCLACGGAAHDFGNPPAAYPYLLGMYLGDGSISLHPRNVARLRIFLDAKYPGIVEETRRAISEMVPRNRVHVGGKRADPL